LYDQSFCHRSLDKEIRKSDFRRIPKSDQNTFRETLLAEAVAAASSSFGTPANPLHSFPLKRKEIYGFAQLSHDLVSRKLCSNLKRIFPPALIGRSQIISNLQLLLEEGVPYRVYRLDVKNFYESFNQNQLLQEIKELQRLSPRSKSLISSLMENYISIGGAGVPRGLALSAALSDFMMRHFDSSIRGFSDVYYYARYVDDIIVVTSAREKSKHLLREVEKNLPTGLVLNNKKKKLVEVTTKVAPEKNRLLQRFAFEYLGYSFKVHEPIQIKNKASDSHFRGVTLDIAETKIKKIKTRITRSFLDYSKNKDWPLLADRIKFLTQNFSVYNQKVGGKKLAGIFHSYPQITNDATALIELDRFLRYAVLSNKGRVFSQSHALLSDKQKRSILGQSFVRGHSKRSFVYFSALRISEIQKCWSY